MTKLIVANWKANLNLSASLKLAKAYVGFKKTNQPIVICASDFALVTVRDIVNHTNIQLGAQDVFWQSNGAYTGEVSAKTLADLGCRYVILGHSERREYLHESCRQVNLKLQAVLANKLTPIVCVGESEAHYVAKKGQAFVKGQLQRALVGIKTKAEIIIAYEPIWAIGTSRAMKPLEAQKMHQYIKQVVNTILGSKAKFRVLYGGSVDSHNTPAFLALDNIDGLLIGTASLKPVMMKKIANFK